MKLWQFHFLSYLKETRLLPPSSHPPTVIAPTTIVALTVPVTLSTPPQPGRTPRPHPPDDRIARQFPFAPHYSLSPMLGTLSVTKVASVPRAEDSLIGPHGIAKLSCY